MDPSRRTEEGMARGGAVVSFSQPSRGTHRGWIMRPEPGIWVARERLGESEQLEDLKLADARLRVLGKGRKQRTVPGHLHRDGKQIQVKAGLGCEDAIVSAELYKLLVYDRGGFFLAHRDTEKADGMFGTLVVTLPSTYRGGALRIRHAGREVTVDTNTVDPSELSCAAFYADCEHEALPVRAGNRICLVYNFVQKQSKTAPNFEDCRFRADCLPRQAWRDLRSPRFSTRSPWHHRRKTAFARCGRFGTGCSRLIYLMYDMVNFE